MSFFPQMRTRHNIRIIVDRVTQGNYVNGWSIVLDTSNRVPIRTTIEGEVNDTTWEFTRMYLLQQAKSKNYNPGQVGEALIAARLIFREVAQLQGTVSADLR